MANIAGTVTDTAGERHSYEGGHYLTITGYTDDGRLVTHRRLVPTSVGSNEYQLPIDTDGQLDRHPRLHRLIRTSRPEQQHPTHPPAAPTKARRADVRDPRSIH